MTENVSSPPVKAHDPSHIAQWLAKALQHHSRGDIDAAIAAYRAILTLQPGHADALHLLGVIAQQKGNPALALQLIEASLARNAGHAAAWTNRALVLRVLGREDDALQSAKMALDADPAAAAAWDLAALILRQRLAYDKALAHHRHALALEPQNWTFRANLAATLLVMGRIAEAYGELSGLPQQHNSGAAHATLGNILLASGHTDRAIACFHRAAERTPDVPGIGVNEALARLKLGDYAEGFRLWQSRVDSRDDFFKAIPKWQGEPAGTLLLYEDQGMGDALQGLRYIPKLKTLARHIIVQIAKPLQPIIAESFPDIAVLTLDDPPAAADARISLMSLPFILQTRLDTIPASVPYLHPDEALRPAWRQRLAHLPQPRIGLVWGGNPGFANDKNRSVPFAGLAPVIAAAQKHMVSFQLGRPDDQTACAASGIFDASPWLRDFADTAAALMEIDLLITVDTAIAHLAGALGRPVWLMLPFDPDWRWMLEREDNLWYPTVKLYRQQAPGDWTGVVNAIANDLAAYIIGNVDVLKPKLWHGALPQHSSRALNFI